MPGGPEGVQRTMEYNTVLTEQYYKVRRQLMLWSGILFAWELVGININKFVLQGMNVGELLKSPQAVPWVFVVLVVYFGGMLALEWRQCPIEAKTKKDCKIHFYSACTVATAALVLYAWQTISGTQIANEILNDSSRFFGILLALMGFNGVVVIWICRIDFFAKLKYVHSLAIISYLPIVFFLYWGLTTIFEWWQYILLLSQALVPLYFVVSKFRSKDSILD